MPRSISKNFSTVSIQKGIICYKSKSENHKKLQVASAQNICAQNSFPCQLWCSGMRQSYKVATSTRLVRLPLLLNPPATSICPLDNSAHEQDDRGEGKSPTLLQLFVVGWYMWMAVLRLLPWRPPMVSTDPQREMAAESSSGGAGRVHHCADLLVVAE